MSDAALPLHGVRVIEMGVWVAGPATAGVLAEWGADVIKVEPPGGDPMRRVLAVSAALKAPENPPFDLDNRGKRSVVLDLKEPTARRALDRLLARADVFVTNYREAALERLDLAPATLQERHPNLVICRITGYGARGPDRGRPGYDMAAFWARAGVALSLVPEGSDPPLLRGGVGDHITALAAVGGISAALLARARDGRGRIVDTSLLRTGIYAQSWDTALQLHYGKVAPPASRRKPMNPLMNPYRAGDERWFWLVGLESDRHWPALARAVGEPGWVGDARFADPRARRHNAAELVALLDAAFARRPLDEWAGIFDAEGVWWAPAQTTAEVTRDPQAAAAGAFLDVPATGGGAGARSVAAPVDFEALPARARGPVPRAGEHTEEVLREAGLDGDDLARLLAAAGDS